MDVSQRPELPTRSKRLVAYLRFNRDQLIVDAAVLLAWILVTTYVSDWFGLPVWLHYILLFVGIVIYSKVTPNWERPYRSTG